MSERIYYLAVAIIMIVCLPLVPNLLRLRIIILRWLRLKWFADFHARHFDRFVLVVRIIMVPIIIFLIVRGVS